MKKIISLLILVSMTATADLDRNQAMYEMMMAGVDSAPDVDEGAACLGVSTTKLQSFIKSAITACFEQNKHKTFEEFTSIIESCIHPQLYTQSGLSKAEFEACQSEEDKQEERFYALRDEVYELQDKIRRMHQEGATNREIASLQAQLAELQGQLDEVDYMEEDEQTPELSPEAMAKMMQIANEYNEKSLHLISLPIFKPSQIMMHMNQQGWLDNSAEVLPAATFATQAPAEKVLAFYRKELPGFTYKDLGNGTHIFMQTMPEDFDLLKHSRLYTSTPHVLISSVDEGGLGIPEGTQASIELAYRAKP